MQNYEQPENEHFPQPFINQEVSPELPLSPNNPPWGGLAAFLAWLASVLFILILPNVFLLPYLLSQQLDLSNQESMAGFIRTDPTAVMIFIGSILPAHLLTLLVSWGIITRMGKFSFFEMTGWKWGGFKWWQILLAIWFILLGFFALAVLLEKVFGNPDNELTLLLKSSTTAVYLIAFIATFTAPLVEEVIYRGLLYSAFQKSLGVFWSVIIVTGLFAAVHMPQYWGSPASIIVIGLLSLTLTLIRVKTDNLLPCIVLHTVINGVQSIGLVAQTFIKDVPDQAVQPATFLIHLFR